MRLTDADALYEKACDLEAQALSYVGKIGNDESKIEEWKIWSAILAERTAFKHDVYDAPTIEPGPQWVPCSERLPTARQSVILSTKDWTGEGCYWETTEHHVIWKGYRWNATYWDDEVIAWCPLPEPYKEEEH